MKTIRGLFLNRYSSDLKNINFDKFLHGRTFHCSCFTKLKVIINYFSRYKLNTTKLLAFQKWSKIHDVVLNKKHLTSKGLNRIDFITKDINKFIS